VAKLRSALRDNAASPRYVETLPTRGYRFIAAVEPPAAGIAAPPAPLAAQAPGIDRGPERQWAAAGFAAVVAILTAIALPIVWAKPAGMPRVVVVPFHNETGSPDLDRVAKGVSDATVARLATPERLKQLKVIGNASDLTFSFKPANMKTMGEALGAQFLVLGQLKKDDLQMRIVAHLIRVSDQTHVWAKTYDSRGLDLQQQAALAEEIAKAVVATVPGG
jgi:TolB-like protein